MTRYQLSIVTISAALLMTAGLAVAGDTVSALTGPSVSDGGIEMRSMRWT